MEKKIEEILERNDYEKLCIELNDRCKEIADMILTKMCILGIDSLSFNNTRLRLLEYLEDGNLREDLVVFRKHYHNECIFGCDYDEDCEYRDYNVYGSLLNLEDGIIYRDSNCIVCSASNDEILKFLLNVDGIVESLDEREDVKVHLANIAIERTDEYFKENDNSTETETVEESK